MQERPFKPMAKGQLRLAQFFRDGKVREEKPAAI